MSTNAPSLLPGPTPEELALTGYNRRMLLFERIFDNYKSKMRKRREFSDYTRANCEEAWASSRIER